MNRQERRRAQRAARRKPAQKAHGASNQAGGGRQKPQRQDGSPSSTAAPTNADAVPDRGPAVATPVVSTPAAPTPPPPQRGTQQPAPVPAQRSVDTIDGANSTTTARSFGAIRLTASSLSATRVTCSALNDAEPQALGITYTFTAADPASTDAPYPLSVTFTGRRRGAGREPGTADTFEATETIGDVLPGSGRVSLTTRIENIPAGDWEITARPRTSAATNSTPSHPSPAAAATVGQTGFLPVVRVRAPGVRPGAWPALVAIGAAVALTVQNLFAVRLGLPALPVLALSLIACLLGLVGARVYYMIEHPARARGWMSMTSGMCIQGFVLTAVAVLLVGSVLVGLPVTTLLDATTPALLFGMGIGRLGCFFGGCCAGRPTASRWGLWSSDRKLGRRRVPTQLYESAAALLLATAVSLVLAAIHRSIGGALFVGGLAAYLTARQLLFPLRDLPRHTAHGRSVVLVVSVLVVIGAVLVGVLGGAGG